MILTETRIELNFNHYQHYCDFRKFKLTFRYIYRSNLKVQSEPYPRTRETLPWMIFSSHQDNVQHQLPLPRPTLVPWRVRTVRVSPPARSVTSTMTVAPVMTQMRRTVEHAILKMVRIFYKILSEPNLKIHWRLKFVMSRRFLYLFRLLLRSLWLEWNK